MTLNVAGLRYKMCENHDAKREMTTVGDPFSVTVVWASQNFPARDIEILYLLRIFR